jgi:hypothetical protein
MILSFGVSVSNIAYTFNNSNTQLCEITHLPNIFWEQ